MQLHLSCFGGIWQWYCNFRNSFIAICVVYCMVHLFWFILFSNIHCILLVTFYWSI